MRQILHQMNLFLLTILVLVTLYVVNSRADSNYKAPQSNEARTLVIISDLHVGLGKIDGEWHPYEDFRWPGALNGFLNRISEMGKHHVDLIIAGDFLELWQAPPEVTCKGGGPNFGCSVNEMVRIITRVVTAHSGRSNGVPRAIDALAAFSQRGENRLHILPGNHDSALLLPKVWSVVAKALNVEEGRVRLVGKLDAGVWSSSDGRVVVEHGQQMGADLNRYDDWPKVLSEKKGLMVRVEGELNVQKLFNEVERDYPIIDNLSPEVMGAWYRAQDRGVWGSIADLAKLTFFLLFETSIKHKGATMGAGPPVANGDVKWDLKYARNELGPRLFALALPKDDKLRELLLQEPQSEKARMIARDLDALLEQLDDGSLQHLCDQLALRSPKARCWDPTSGAMVEVVLKSRERVKRGHLETRQKKYPGMKFFIYGHTHHLEQGHSIKLEDGRIVTVFNSGAFQRVMDSENYRRRLQQAYPSTTVAQGLKVLDLNRDFKPCYTAVIGEFKDGNYKFETKRWYMAELGVGKFVPIGSKLCSW